MLVFQKEVNEQYSRMKNTSEFLKNIETRLGEVEKSLLNSPNADLKYLKDVKTIKSTLQKDKIVLYGDSQISKYQFETLPSLSSRISTIMWSQYYVNANTTNTNKTSLEYVKKELTPLVENLKKSDENLKSIENYIKDNNLMPLTIEAPKQSEEGDW